MTKKNIFYTHTIFYEQWNGYPITEIHSNFQRIAYYFCDDLSEIFDKFMHRIVNPLHVAKMMYV